MKLFMKSAFCMMILSVFIVGQAVACSPCQAARSAKDALAQSIKDVQMAALVAGGSYSKQSELDEEEDEVAKCKPCQSRTNRDEALSDLNIGSGLAQICCEFCAEPGSLGCQGLNSAQCPVCLNGVAQMSLAEIAAALVASTQSLLDQAEALDIISDVVSEDLARAPRQSLPNPCNNCGTVPSSNNGCNNNVSEQLAALRCCCTSVAQMLVKQGKEAKKCCKHLSHKINGISSSANDALLTSILDQTAACCASQNLLLLSILDIVIDLGG
jgi:hypothetical protein